MGSFWHDGDNRHDYKYFNRVGWYVGEQYYSYLGWSKSYVSQDITGQNRQTWKKTDSEDEIGWYAPLFVDLTDNWDQRSYYGTAYAPDGITNVPPSVIWNIIINCVNLSELKRELNKYVGTYYSSAQLAAAIMLYACKKEAETPASLEGTKWVSSRDYWALTLVVNPGTIKGNSLTVKGVFESLDLVMGDVKFKRQ